MALNYSSAYFLAPSPPYKNCLAAKLYQFTRYKLVSTISRKRAQFQAFFQIPARWLKSLGFQPITTVQNHTIYIVNINSYVENLFFLDMKLT